MIMNAIGIRNILLFLPMFPSHVATAKRPIPARSWFAAPKSPQIFPYPFIPSRMPSTTVRMVAKYGFTMTFFQPSLISAAVSPGSSQNSWNMKRARRVAVSREVRQNAEYVSTSKEFKML